MLTSSFLLLFTAAAEVTSSTPSVTFSIPALVGSANLSAPNGSSFWFPAISIPTGIAGHVAQHITLSGDGGGGCEFEGRSNQVCEQIMITRDGGRTYHVTKKIRDGTSGNFNGYGDLGSWVPPKKGAKVKAGEFQAISGCNNCFARPGGSLVEPAFLQTWLDTGSNLTLTRNVSVTYKDTPAAFMGKCGQKGSLCGFSSPDQSIVRTSDSSLLMALYGHSADGYMNGSLYTTAFYSSSDDGLTWNYASRMDVTAAMVNHMEGPGEGPCEPSMATLADGRVLAAFRLGGSHPLWLAYSSDNGKSWTDPAPAQGRKAAESPGTASAVYAVWPQLLMLSNGVLVLASGRPGIGFWVSPQADGASWVGYDVEAEHSRNLPSDPWDAKHGTGTTSYTGIAEVEPGVVLLAYDKTSGAGRSGDIQKVYSVRIEVRNN
jgi:hypothetical protein